MNTNTAALIYFSPTGTTKKILNAIAEGMGIGTPKVIDLTSVAVRNGSTPQIDEEIVLIGVPVYEERIPKILYSFLTSLKGDKKPVVLIAVYGNIGEGIVLNELCSITENSGFRVLAAASFIGEHSFSTEELPIAKGRPTFEDLQKAQEFGRSIVEKLQRTDVLNSSQLSIPEGKLPLLAKVLPENSARMFTKTPTADMSICNRCGACVKLCPIAAIDKETLKIKEDECLRCFCCVKRCSKKARKIVYKKKFLVSRVLASKNKVINEPRIYL